MNVAFLHIRTKLKKIVQCASCYLECQLQIHVPHDMFKLENMKELKLTQLEHPVGEPVQVIGFNQDGRQINCMATFENGCTRETRLAKKIGEGKFCPHYEIIVMCNAYRGQSGGPCINCDGEVIGMVSRGSGKTLHLVPYYKLMIILKKAKDESMLEDSLEGQKGVKVE